MRMGYFLLLTLAVVVSSERSAFAHAVLEPREASIGAPYRGTLKITHGCNGSDTVKVRMLVPEGLIGVKPMPKAGWTIEVVRGAYARAYPFFHGQEVKEGIKELIWTGRLPDDYFDEFVFSGLVAQGVSDAVLYFPTYQECEKGSYAWTQVPAGKQDPHALEMPAPSLRLLAAADKTAASFKIGSLVIEAPWIRATPDGAQVAGGYVKVTNAGKDSDRLVGGTLAIAQQVEVHEMTMSGDGVAKMRHLADGLEIKPGQSIELKPGGYHLMFMGLKSQPKAGDGVRGTLIFEKAGTVDITFKVEPLGSSTPQHGHH